MTWNSLFKYCLIVMAGLFRNMAYFVWVNYKTISMKYALLFALSGMLLVLSCKKDKSTASTTSTDSSVNTEKPKDTTICPRPILTTMFVGFTTADSDTMIMKKYKAGSGFTALYDSVVLKTNISQPAGMNGAPMPNGMPKETIQSYYGAQLSADTDYILVLPAADTSYYISQISHNIRRRGDCVGCPPRVISGCRSEFNPIKVNNYIAVSKDRTLFLATDMQTILMLYK